MNNCIIRRKCPLDPIKTKRLQPYWKWRQCEDQTLKHFQHFDELKN